MLIFIALILAAVFGPMLWVRWVMQRYATEIPELPGTGGELAQHLVKKFKLNGVSVGQTDLGDHYDPEAKQVNLSAANYSGRSLPAVAVAAHEVGHAIQHQQGDKRLAARGRWVVVANKMARFGAAAMWAAPVLGLLMRHPVPFSALAVVGLSSLLVRMLVHLFTLPTEFDASFGKALPILQEGRYVPVPQQRVVRRILTAAALTYVSAALADMLNLARWATLLLRR